MDRTGRRAMLLLLPTPPASLLYLLAIRGGDAAPAFGPLVALALLPIAAAAAVLPAARRGRRPSRRLVATVLVAALLELAWLTVAAAAVGMAIGLRSG